jgi:hypothetical protein
VVDEIKYLHIGLDEVRQFFSFAPTALGLSYVDNFEGGRYKVAGFTIFRSLNQIITYRTTYDLLAFLGYVGGLEAIIFVLGGAIVGKFTSFSISLKMFSQFYYERIESKEATSD